MKNNIKQLKNFWWGLFTCLLLFVSGIIIQKFICDFDSDVWRFPLNIATGCILIYFILSVQLAFKTKKIALFLSSAGTSIGVLGFLVVMLLIPGFIPQLDNSFVPYNDGFWIFDRIFESWSFILIILFFLLVLGSAIARRITTFSRRNLYFFINHFGLWIAIFGAFFGAPDLKRYRVPIDQTHVMWQGYTHQGTVVELAFGLRLKNFTIEQHDDSKNVKQYSSEIMIYEHNKHVSNIFTEVNRPAKYKGFRIYQSGFERLNNDYRVIVELVHDPWLWVVYSGFILILLGAVLMFDKRKDKSL